jgi:hypothetical protein
VDESYTAGMNRVQNPNHATRYAEEPGGDLRLCGENGSPCACSAARTCTGR